MKRALLALVALTLVFAVVSTVAGCNNGTTTKKTSPSSSPSPSSKPGFTHDLVGAAGTYAITLTGNFQYGDGYQFNIDDAKLMGGEKIVKGDVFTLEIEFTGSRDLKTSEKELTMGFADSTPEADYWKPLTWEGDAMVKVEGKDLTAKKTGTYTFTALANATSAAVKANVFNIQFQSPDDKAASGNSGTYNPSPVTLTFTKFVLTRN